MNNYKYDVHIHNRTRHLHLTRIQITQYRAIRDTSVEDREQEDNTSAREHS